ncbi:MAG: SPFH domain-containing protein [Gemmataceae bacterium]|nr:SPFH domain-containing protein [Gemmataceae bacterium]
MALDIEVVKIIAYCAIPVVVLLFGSISVIQQGHVGVAVLFGKYRRLLHPGLSFRIPFVEKVFRSVSLQHRSAELEFQAITGDQANVNFKTMIIYAVANGQEETILKAAFKFIDDRSFMQSLIRSIEGSIRSFVAIKKQSEILSLRREIVDEVNSYIEHELQDWGFHLIALQVNDISFDEAILRSMAQVVASNNMMLAAQNEAEAQFITKTRVAEAEAQAKRLVAQAEKDVDKLRGEGNALLRKEMAIGLVDAHSMMESNGVDHATMLYTEWLDAMKTVASNSHGNILSFDGSMEGFDKTMKQMTQLNRAAVMHNDVAHD